MPLTDTKIRKAKPGDKPHKLADGGGLYLLITKAGKYWRWKYRHQGKERVMALGVYPDVSLTQARKLHQDARAVLASDLDPAKHRQEQRSARQAQALNFETVARRWWEHWKDGCTDNTAMYVMARLEADIFPEIGAHPVASIQTSAFRDAVKKIEARGALDMAKRNWQVCGQIMRYAVAHDLAERNPVADVRPGDILKTRPKRNFSRVTEQELPALLAAIEGYAGGEHTVLALKLMALTFVRTSELIAAKWAEFDLDAARWNIPAERMKMRTPHVVPLSRQALAVLEKLKAISYGRDLLFPGERNHAAPMSNNTILFALYRMGYRSRMTGHGFRGVASTILHEHGWPHEHIEAQLAHQERNAVSAAYNHAQYLQQRAKMMQWWGNYLESLITTGNVVFGKFNKAA